MGRWINTDLFFECETCRHNITMGCETLCDHGKSYIPSLAKFPTADVVEVVRCKDCKYFEIEDGDILGLCKCGYIAVSYNGELYPKETDFCSYGEKALKERDQE